MKKILISIGIAFLLFFGGLTAWASGHGVLAVLLLFATLVLSCYFEEGRKEEAKRLRELEKEDAEKQNGFIFSHSLTPSFTPSLARRG